MKEFKVKVIGGAGAFSKDNSSFLLTFVESEYMKINLLFDCPENSFYYIKDNNINVDAVFISHTHQDHIGGLEKLIYYNYFVNKKITKILAHQEIEIEKHLPEQIIYENGEIRPVKMYELYNDFSLLTTTNFEYEFDFIKGNHIIKKNYGLKITLTDKISKNIWKNHCLIITGDTKATPDIRNEIINFKNNSEYQ
jgi:ribonuclease BN (tRNA processing enzyme)